MLALGLTDALALLLGEILGLVEAEGLTDVEGEIETLVEEEGLTEVDGEILGDSDELGEMDAEGLTLGLAEAEGDTEELGEIEAEGEVELAEGTYQTSTSTMLKAPVPPPDTFHMYTSRSLTFCHVQPPSGAVTSDHGL